MGLRSQLLLVGAMTLALPWAGCQYVQEMELTLRQGQLTALQATAQAVASRIASDASLMESVESSVQGLSIEHPEHAYYAHALTGNIVLDGYGDDWRTLGFQYQSFSPLNSKGPIINVLMGQHSRELNLLLQIHDSERQFFNPSEGVKASDHIVFYFDRGENETNIFRIFTAASGAVSVEGQGLDGVWYREHRIAGVWNEGESSYIVELKVPLDWIKGGLAIKVLDGAKSEGVVDKGMVDEAVADKDIALMPVIAPKKLFSGALDVFSRPGVKLYLTAPGGWSLGQSGSVGGSLVRPDNIIYWVVRRIIGESKYSPRQNAEAEGRLLGSELDYAQEGILAQQWYTDNKRTIGRVVVPIVLNNGKSSVVVAEESTDSIEALTTGAIGRLIFYSLLATAIAGFALLSFASILSFRIRKLSQNVQQAVDSEGRIKDTFLASRSRDEIGDLSRSYGALLLRLQSYTDYLETLSGKLSHELRTPLAVVRSSLDNLEHYSLPKEEKVYVDRASEGTQRLSAILNAMSAASRVEQSIQSSELERVDLADLLRQIVAAYQDIYAPRNIHLDLSDHASLVIQAAPELLVQMLDKLVENAADFSGEKGSIRFELQSLDKEVVLRVINTGPPLPERLQGQIFDSLVSGRDAQLLEGKAESRQKIAHHLGLGLYVVRLIVKFHQGEISAYNHPDGHRVVFEISLPNLA